MNESASSEVDKTGSNSFEIKSAEDLDTLIKEEGDSTPVAIFLKQCLIPVGGKGSIVFPPSYPGAQDTKDENSSIYIINEGPNGTKMVDLDSVGSQANRMEKLLLENSDGIVPKIRIKFEYNLKDKSGKKEFYVDMLELGHRAADAVIKNTDKKEEIAEALRNVANGDYSGLARLSPTSILFGMWDSRMISGEGIKIPRMLTSKVMGYDVYELKRGSQYTPAYKGHVDKGTLMDSWGIDPKPKTLSRLGFDDVPNIGLGGVIVNGDIIRESTLSLIALRNVKSKVDQLKLQRYILSLGIFCMMAEIPGEYRSGCHLVPDLKKTTAEIVYRNGERKSCKISIAKDFVKQVATDFGVNVEQRTFNFKVDDFKEDIKNAEKKNANKDQSE